MYNFKIINYNYLKEVDYNTFKNVNIYMTYNWLQFLKKSIKIVPLVIEIYLNDNKIGYFIGGQFKIAGINIIGSPFRGWDTPYMGFVLKSEFDINILDDFWKFIKEKTKCVYMEICDINIPKNVLLEKNYKFIKESTYFMDITNNEEDLLNSFTKHCKKDLKLFVNRGAYVNKVTYSDDFLDGFYIMLTNVFKCQGLLPPYSKEKLSILFNEISEENILCLETYNPNGKCIGMSVSFGYGEYCYAFASATDRNENYNQKNVLRWEAIKYWKKTGKKYYDLMGIRQYKLEFNPSTKEYYRIVFTKYGFLLTLRNIAKTFYWKFNKLKFAIINKKNIKSDNANNHSISSIK